jgi:glycosyltransferase involved in cell wall biosynthesis
VTATNPAGGAPLHVCAVTHELTRTGAPIVLLRILRRLAREGVRVDVLSRRDGPLRAEFEAVGRLRLWDEGRDREVERLLRRARLGFLWPGYERVSAWRLARIVRDVDVIYANTLTNGRLLRRLQRARKPVLTHVHELGPAARAITRPVDLAYALERSATLLAVSRAVADDLRDDFAVPGDKIVLVPGCVDDTEVDPSLLAATKSTATPPYLLVTVGLFASWSKGSDLLVPLALSVLRRLGRENVRFRWVGTDSTINSQRLAQDVAASGLQDRVELVPRIPQVWSELAGADLLLLPSRLDAYPLAMLEAATLGTPTICFDGSGGAPEFVGNGAGVVVPHLDVELMAQAVVDLLSSPGRLADMGVRARRLAAEHSVEEAAGRIRSELERTAATASTG